MTVDLSSLNRTDPISRVFGLDRGTPIDRYYIEKFISENAKYIKGRVLEISESYYSKTPGSGPVDEYEVLHATQGNKYATIIGDLTDINTLPENRMDCFICTQTLNFIYDVRKALKGAHYLLKPGGILLATVAGISQISRYDMSRWGDYWRFTNASIERLVRETFKGMVQINSYGNVLAATAFLQGMAIQDMPNLSLLDKNDGDYQLIITIVAEKNIK